MNSALNEKSTQSNKLLTLGEAARLLKISDTSLRRYATQGKIQSTRTDLGYRLFSQKDVEEFRVQLNTEKEEYRKKLAQLSVQKVQPLKPTKKLKSIYIRNALAGVAGVLTFFIISLVLLQNIPLTNSIGGIKTAVANTDKLIKSKISFLNKPKAAATQSEDVLGATDINANWVFKINRPTFLQEQVEVEKDINVSGALTVAQLSTLAGGIVTNNQNANLGVGTLIGGIINLTGPAAINNLTAIDTQSETSLEGFLDLDGDITSTGLNETEVNALRGESLGDTTTDEGNLLMAVGGEWVSTPQIEITQLGTIEEGIWNGTAITPSFGGTGLTTYATGDMLYASGANTLANLPIGANGYVLTSNGTTPVWQANGAASSIGVTSLTSANEAILLSGATGPVQITLNLATTGISSSTASNSGLEITTDGLKMLGGCANGQLLTWDAIRSVWKCGSSIGGGTVNGSGNSGQVSYWTANDTIGSSASFVWDSVNSRLGIGTTSPLAALSVGTNSAFQVNSSGAITTATGLTSSGTVTFSGLSANNFVKTTTGGQLTTAATVDLGTEASGILSALYGGTGMNGATAPNGSLLLGNGSGFSANIMSGDATIVSSGALTLAASGVAAGTYGSSTGTPVISIDAKGRIISASTIPGAYEALLTFADGLTRNANTIVVDATTSGATSITASNSGLEVTASGVRMIGGCALNEVLAWNSGANRWECKSLTGVGGTTGSGAVNQVAIWSGTSQLIGTDSFYWNNSTERLGLGTTAPAAALSVGATNQFQVTAAGAIAAATGITSSGTITFSGLSANSFVKTTTGGELTTVSAIDLSTGDVTGLLSPVRGGTGLDGSTAPVGSLLLGSGTGFTVKSMSGDATISSSGLLTLANSGVTGGTYGSITGTPVITIDSKGRITSASTAALSYESPLTFSDGLTRTSNTIVVDATTSGATSITASNSGLEVTATGVRMIGGCALNEVLAWNSGANRWECKSLTGVGGTTGTGAANQVSFWTGTSQLSGTDAFYWNNSTERLGLGTTSPQYKLDVVGDARLSAGSDLYLGTIKLGSTGPSNNTSGAFKIGVYDEFANSNSTNTQAVLKDFDDDISILYTAVGGTAASHNPVSLTGAYDYLSLDVGTQVLTMNQIDLTTDVTGILPVANGGTGLNTTTAPTGSLLIGNGTGFTLSAMSGDASIASNGILTLASTGVTATTYGSANGIPVITVDAKGRITSASTVPGNYEAPLTFSDGLTRTGNTIVVDATTSGATSITASNSGLEVTATGVRMIGGCALNEVLAWNSGANRWECKSLTGVGGVTGSGATNQISFWTGTSQITGTDSFYWNNSLERLGIGTSGPDAKLHIVGGDIYAAPDSGYAFNNPSALNDIYVNGNLEVDSTIYGTTAALGQINIGADIISDFVGSTTGLALTGSTLTIDATTTSTTSTTASNSGLELTAAGLRLIGGCTNNQGLVWDTTQGTWKCSSDAIGSGVNGRLAFWNSTNTLASDQALFWDFANARLGIGTSTPSSRLHVSNGDAYIAANSGFSFNNASALDDLYVQGNLEVDGNIFGTTASIGQLGIGGDTITDFVGASTGLAISGTTLTIDATTSGGTSTTAASSGLELTASGLRIIGGCSSNEVLAWNSGAARWECASLVGVGGITGTGAANQVSFWSGSSSQIGNDNFYWNNSLERLGIGTSGPDAKLHIVGGDIYAAPDSGYAFNNPSALNDLYVNGNLEVDGTLYGTTASLGQLAVASNITIGGETIGDFVGSGLIISGTAVTVDAVTTSTTSTTAANSGLEVTTAGIRLLGGCSANQVLAWNAGATRWECTSTATGTVTGSGANGRLAFWNSSSAIASDQALFWDFSNIRLGIGTSTPSARFHIAGGDAYVAANSSFSFNNPSALDDLYVQGNIELDGTLYGTTASLGQLAIGGDTITDFVGASTGLALTGTTLTIDATTTGTTSTTASNSGLEVTASGIRMIGGCSLNEVLAWNAGASRWECKSLTGVGGTTGSGTANQVAIWSGTSQLSGTDAFYWDSSLERLGIGTTAPGYKLDVNGSIRAAANSSIYIGSISIGSTGPSNTTSGAYLIGAYDEFDNSNSSNVQAVLNDFDDDISILYSAIGGTAASHNPVTLAGSYDYLSLDVGGQVLTLGQIDLTTDVTGILPVANGGTGLNTTTAPVGSLLIGNGTGFTLSALGGDATVAANGTLTLANSGVTAATYGSSLGVPVITVDSKGRLTGVSTAPLSYESPLTFSDGLTRTGNTIVVDATTTGSTSTTASNSGLEVTAAGIRMIGGCSLNEVLAWNAGANRWECKSLTGVGGVTGSGTANQVTFWSGTSSQIGNDNFYWNNSLERLGIGTSGPDTKLHVVGGDVYFAADGGYSFNNASALNDLYVQGNIELDGTLYGTTASLGQLAIGGDTITDFVGASTGLALTGTTLTIDATTTSTTSTTASNSGLELTAAGLRVIGGCSNQQVMAWNAGASRWECTSNSMSGSGVNGRLAFWNGTSSLASDQDLFWDFTNKRLGIGTSTPTNKLDVAGNAVIGSFAGTNTAPTNGLLVSGRTGIGTTAASYQLEVKNDATTTGALRVLSDSLTTGTGSIFSFDALTSGTGILIESNPSAATTLSGDLFRINIGSNTTVTGNIFSIEDNGIELFTVDENIITSALPHEFTAAGDVSMAYDLIFTNDTSSQISSYGPFSLIAGRSYESSNLTLQVYNNGDLNVNLGTGGTASGSQMLVTSDTSDLIAGFFNDGNADTRDGVYIQGCLDTNPTSACNLLELRDGNGTIIGAIEGNGAGGVTNASSGSDYAELFNKKMDTILEPGDIIALDKNGFAVKAVSERKLLGAYSNNPNTLGNWFDGWEKNPRVVPVGLLGQLNIKVSYENGRVMSGDPIAVSSKTPGIGMKSIEAQRVLGFAMEDAPENKPKDKDYVMVKVYINPTWFDPNMELGAYGELVNKVNDLTLSFDNVNANLASTTSPADLIAENVAYYQGQIDNLKRSGDELHEKVLGISTKNAELDTEITSIKENMEIINQILGLDAVDQTSETSTSTPELGLAKLITDISNIYNEVKEFIASLGINIDTENNILTIEPDLNVLGSTTLRDVAITGDLTAGLIEIDTLGNEINVLGTACYNPETGKYNEILCDAQTLYLQKQLSGNVDFFNGAIVLQADGTIKVQQLAIDTTKEERSSAGKTTIAAGQTEIEINTSALKLNSLILVTPNKPVVVGREVLDEDTFKVVLQEPLDTDVEVDWLIVELK